MNNSVLKNVMKNAGIMLNRFGISALSKRNKEDALDGEIMVDKTTGEFLVKSEGEGYVISFDAMARMKSMLEDVDHMNRIMNMKGKVYLIDLDHLHLPTEVQYDTNLLANTITLKRGSLNRMLFHVDLDEIIPNPVAQRSTTEPYVNLDIHCTRTGFGQESYSIDFNICKPVSELNSRIIISDELNIEYSIKDYNVELVGLSILKNPNNTVPNSKIVLHGATVTID